MKRFVFTLEAVATLRRHELERAAVALEAAAAAVRRTEAELASLHAGLSGSALSRAGGVCLPAADLARQATWESVLRERIVQVRSVLETQRRTAQDATQAWHQAHRRLEAMEKVRASRLELHRQSALILEQKAMEEHGRGGGLARALLDAEEPSRVPGGGGAASGH